MSKIFDFPKNKDEIQLLVPERDFNHLLRTFMRQVKTAGRHEGFLIGIIIANIVHLVVNYFFK